MYCVLHGSNIREFDQKKSNEQNNSFGQTKKKLELIEGRNEGLNLEAFSSKIG
jgi:hypothetical protein